MCMCLVKGLRFVLKYSHLILPFTDLFPDPRDSPGSLPSCLPWQLLLLYAPIPRIVSWSRRADDIILHGHSFGHVAHFSQTIARINDLALPTFLIEANGLPLVDDRMSVYHELCMNLVATAVSWAEATSETRNGKLQETIHMQGPACAASRQCGKARISREICVVDVGRKRLASTKHYMILVHDAEIRVKTR
jgi:hypothetical protein